jgi:hypothetical protein
MKTDIRQVKEELKTDILQVKEEMKSNKEVMQLVTPMIARVSAKMFNPWTRSKITATRLDDQRAYFIKLLNYPHSKIKQNYSHSKIPCMVSQMYGSGEQVVAAHLIPRNTDVEILAHLKLAIDDVNGPRNVLFLAKNIELAFDALQLSFIPVDVLHPSTFKMLIWDDNVRATPIWSGSDKTIGEYDGCVLTLSTGHMPLRRCLSYQAYQCWFIYRSALHDEPDEFGSPPTPYGEMRSKKRQQFVSETMLVDMFETSLKEEVAEK